MSPVEINSNGVGRLVINGHIENLPYMVKENEHIVIFNKSGAKICEVWGRKVGGSYEITRRKRAKILAIGPEEQERVDNFFLTGKKT